MDTKHRHVVHIRSIIALLQLGYVVNGQQKMQYIRDEGQRVDTVFRTLVVDSVMACCAVCRAEDTCRSLNYESSSGTCEMNDRNPPLDSYAQTSSLAGWVAFYTTIAACPDGWQQYQTSCYMAVTTPSDWESSETMCQSFGGHLVDLQDSLEHSFVHTNLCDGRCWIGLNDREQEGVFTWSSSRSFAYNAWYSAADEPNGGEGEDCTLTEDLSWHDFPCSSHYKSVCETTIY